MMLSVVICSHNPREDHLHKTLCGLQDQTLPTDKWELLLVDNASEAPLTAERKFSWHPNARLIREASLGVTFARLRGIAEAQGDTLVFVDDDNVLAPEYLEAALAICAHHPFLGAIGGRIDPEYEKTCPEWFKPYEQVLAIRGPKTARWSNAWDDWQSQPWGAGMVVRRKVCEAYAKMVDADPRKLGMDRAGRSLFSGGDTDMVLTCLDLSLGYGVFPELVLKHLIPPSRVEPDYLLKITRALKESDLWLKHLRGHPWTYTEKLSWYTHLRSYYHFLKRDRIGRKLEEATLAGQEDFLARLDEEKKRPREAFR